MAKAGKPSQTGRRTPDAEATRTRLIESTIETLRSQGFSATSARSIARHADCNQALVFYHFGSVANLLVAALEVTSNRRMERYAAAIAEAKAEGFVGLAGVAAQIFREDLDGGHMAVLAEIIAGASSVPGLGAEVSAHIAPWIEFTETTVAGALASTPFAQLLPAGDVAYAIVALYLGIEMLAHLDDDRSRAESLFTTLTAMASLLGLGTGKDQLT